MGALNDSIKQLQAWLTSHYKALLQLGFEKVTEAQQNLIQSLSQIESSAAYIPFERFLKMKNEMSKSVVIPPYITIGQTQISVAKNVKRKPLSMPFLLPLCEDGVFFFEGDLGATGIPDLFQMIMLRLSLSIPLELCRFHMVDCDFGRSFHYFNSLRNPKIQKQLYSADEVPGLLRDMVAVLKDTNSSEVGMYPNLSEYNRANPKLAKPYHFIFIDDFPRSCSGSVLEQLKLMMNNGNAMSAGIYLFINFSTTSDALPRDFDLEDFKSYCLVVTSKANGETVMGGSSDVFDKQQHVNVIETSIPSNFAAIASLCEVKEVEKKPLRKFYDIPEVELWAGVSTSEINIPVGTTEDGDEVALHFTQQNALNTAVVVGSPGSGKSKFLHSLILNAALRYSPDELEMYLLDFSGVELGVYDRMHLPHAKVIALEAGRETVVNVLEKIDNEGKRRKGLCRDNAVGSIEALRTKNNQIVPQILVVIDDFQELSWQKDELGHRACSCINNIIQKYRKFAINLILSSQKVYQLKSDILIDEIGNRVAFLCNPRDSELVGLYNASLELPNGHFIYNDATGAKDANMKVQTFRIDEDEMAKAMNMIEELGKTHTFTEKKTIVYRGSTVKGDIIKKVEPKEQNWRFYDIPEVELWAGVSTSEINIPVGTTEDGDEVALHFTQQNALNTALVVGTPGSGKSKFLHSIILNAALRYSPDELEMYLLDFSGVEFDVYAREHLPHAKVIAPESEREFGGNILEEIYQEGIRRERLCRDYAVDNIKALRKKNEQMIVPRILVVIDEFQELLRLNDKVSQDAKSYINHIIQKYRKFAINLILASQKAYEVKSELSIDEIGNRIAFTCNPRDSELVGLDNTSLELPNGHFIHNDATGAKNANKKAQTFKMDEDAMAKAMAVIKSLSTSHAFTPKNTVVFRSQKLPQFNPAIITSEDSPKEVRMFFGQSFTVRDSDISVSISGESNDNVLILGGEKVVAQEIAMFMMTSTILAYSRKEKASFYIFNFMREDNPLYGQLENYKNYYDAEIVFASKVNDVIDSLQKINDLVEIRKTASDNEMQNINEIQDVYIFIYATELSLAFKKLKGDYGLEQSEAMKILNDILYEGPLRHVYTILQIDNYQNFQYLEFMIDFFNHRIALQMSESDSEKVLGDDVASKLYVEGHEWTKYKGYYFNQSKNLLVKFRPYNSQIKK